MVTAERQTPSASDRADESIHHFVEVSLRFPSKWKLTWELLNELSDLNEGLQFERTVEGALLIVTGTAPIEADWIENQLRAAIGPWMQAGGGGLLRGGAGGYTLPDTSLRIPDLSWIPDEMMPARGDTAAWRAEPVLVPPFAVEIRSPGQGLASQQRKMEQYIANGVRLGWLFDPIHRQVHVYRPEHEPEILDNSESLSGEDVMEDLVVDLSDIWP